MRTREHNHHKNAYIPREIEPVVRECLASFAAVVITGPRQSGKTTLVRHVAPSHRYISLDDPLLRAQAEDDPELLLGDPDGRLILDEIQNVPSLLSFLKRRTDAHRDARGRFVLTGSQQFASMRGATESLAGRTAVLELLPFTLGEASAADAGPRPRDAAARFAATCLRGLYPEPVVVPTMAAHLRQSAYV